MPFCSNCGAKVMETDKFCNNCGAPLRPVETHTPVNDTPPPPPTTYTPPASVGETVNVTISNFQKPKSFGRWDAYILLATPLNLMIVQLTKDMINQSIRQVQEQAKSEGKGFFGQWAAQLGTSFDYAAQYRGCTKEQVLAKVPSVLIIPHSSVSQVELRSERQASYGKEVDASIYKLRIHAGGTKHEYEAHSLDPNIKAFHDLYAGRFKTNVYF